MDAFKQLRLPHYIELSHHTSAPDVSSTMYVLYHESTKVICEWRTQAETEVEL